MSLDVAYFIPFVDAHSFGDVMLRGLFQKTVRCFLLYLSHCLGRNEYAFWASLSSFVTHQISSWNISRHIPRFKSLLALDWSQLIQKPCCHSTSRALNTGSVSMLATRPIFALVGGNNKTYLQVMQTVRTFLAPFRGWDLAKACGSRNVPLLLTVGSGSRYTCMTVAQIWVRFVREGIRATGGSN